MTQPAKRCITGLSSKVTAILGSQWGDEGKGKLVDILAEKYDICGRFNGGANAGHTVVVNGNKYAFHLLPCGILYDTCVNLLGNGVVVHVPTMQDELKQLDRDKIDYKGRLLLSNRAHLVVNAQLEADAASESKAQPGKQLGTTKRGIGPTYTAKAARYGLRVGDLLYWDNFQEKYNYLNQKFNESHGVKIDKDAELKEIKNYRDYLLDNKMIVDGVLLMNQYLREGRRILVEGANATMLDLDYGTYPYVTSSSTTIGGVCTGAAVPPSKVETSIGIMKAYTTRVGEGPFPTELKDNIGEHLQTVGHEFGATTGRKRRCGWLDLQVVKYSHMINDFSSLNMTKLDVLSGLDEIKIGTHYTIDGKKVDYMPSTIEELATAKVAYETLPGWKDDISKAKKWEDLPRNAQNYVRRVQELLNIPITWIGTGAPRESIIKTETGAPRN